MYTLGKIIYFDPFYFKNGNHSKPKYFIVLNNESNNTILASLPTRGDFVPSTIKIKHGCIDAGEINFNCYHFEANKVICTNNWAFDQPTFVYGNQIDLYDLKMLEDIYQVENIEYKIIGTLKKEEFKKLIECFSNSSSVKRKFKTIFQKMSK